MKYLSLVLAGLWRKPTRTIFTFLSVMVAFILFGIMASVDANFTHQVEIARLDRLYVDPRFPGPMPIAYQNRIATVPGVTAVIPVANTGGYWKEQRNGFGVTFTDERYVIARPEYRLTDAQLRAVVQSRNGIIVSKTYAVKYGWKVGDRIQLANGAKQVNGRSDWSLQVMGITDNYDMPDTAMFTLGSYRYFDEGRAANKGTADRFLVRISDGDRAAEVSRAIDDLFANSPKPTRSQAEKTQAQASTGNIGDISFFTRAIIGAVLFMLLFLTGNTMMQSIRERVPEFGVMKTLGFSDGGVFALVLAEAVFLCTVAGLTGLGVLKIITPVIVRTMPGNAGTILNMTPPAAIAGLIASLLMAVIAGLIPAMRVKRLNIVDALAGR